MSKLCLKFQFVFPNLFSKLVAKTTLISVMDFFAVQLMTDKNLDILFYTTFAKDNCSLLVMDNL